MGIFSLFFSLAKHSLKYDFLLLWVLHTHHGTWDAENFVKQTHPRLHQFHSVYFENKLKIYCKPAPDIYFTSPRFLRVKPTLILRAGPEDRPSCQYHWYPQKKSNIKILDVLET